MLRSQVAPRLRTTRTRRGASRAALRGRRSHGRSPRPRGVGTRSRLAGSGSAPGTRAARAGRCRGGAPASVPGSTMPTAQPSARAGTGAKSRALRPRAVARRRRRARTPRTTNVAAAIESSAKPPRLYTPYMKICASHCWSVHVAPRPYTVISSRLGRPFSTTSRPAMRLSQLSLTTSAGGKISRKMRPNPARRTMRMYSSSAMRRMRCTRYSSA